MFSKKTALALLGGAFLLAAVGAAVLYGALGEKAEKTGGADTDFSKSARFIDTEAGFNGGVPEYMPELVTLPQVEGRPFFGWGAYWEEFSEEEARFYGSFVRPPGPPRVGLQPGHWRVSEVPEELEGLQRSGSGAEGGGITEAAAALEIARRVQALLEVQGVLVDLLPAAIPPSYVADAFVSIHADGSTSSSVSGFKISGPRQDFSGHAGTLEEALYESYEETTGFRRDPNVTRRMSGYYAFNWRRYEHALHPMTPAVIVETGFMTNAGDRRIIVENPEIAARGIAEGVMSFLESRFDDFGN